MSLDLTHGFLAEAQLSESVVKSTFASTFLRRVGVFRDGGLELWFERPRLSLVKDADPAANKVQVELRTVARLSDRWDEGHLWFTAQGTLTEWRVDQRLCPALDFNTWDIVLAGSDQHEYDAVVVPAVINLLRRMSPFTAGPLSRAELRTQFRTYFDVGKPLNHVLSLFLDLGLGSPPPTPSSVMGLADVETDAEVLVPDDLVNPAIQQGLAASRLAPLPVTLREDVTLTKLDVSLQSNHLRIDAAGDAEAGPLTVGFTYTAYCQPVLRDGRIQLTVLRTDFDVESPIVDLFDFLTGGLVTRRIEEMVPSTLQAGALGGIGAMDFFAAAVPDEDMFVRSELAWMRVFTNGISLRFDVLVAEPAEAHPTYLRGHVDSKEFHVDGCEFGDRISTTNLRRFPRWEAAVRAGYDGCATCQPQYSIAGFGDISVELVQEDDAAPVPVTVSATYAGSAVRFGVPVAPDPLTATATHATGFGGLVPGPWSVTLSAPGWSTTDTIVVDRRWMSEGQLQGSSTKVRAVVGQPGIERVP